MMKRTKSFRVKAVVVGAALTLLLGAGAASASQGADDGVGQVRHSGDAVGHVRHGGDMAKASGRVRNSSDDKAKAAARVRNSVTKAKAVTQVRRSDDGVGHVRHTGVHALGHR
jgi:hypothetical protein